MSTLYLSLLGPPELRHGERLLAFPTRKALALLIYLAVEGGTHTRKHLSELFWPELDAEHGRAALRATLQQLRTSLAEEKHVAELSHVRIDRDTLAVDFSSDILLDVHRLYMVHKQSEALTGSEPKERTDTLRAALLQVTQLARGEFLAGFALRDVAAFDDWTRYHRDTTHRYLRHIYERLTTLLTESGETEQALETVTRWLTFDPLDEQGYQHLMRLHVTLGDRTSALRAYQACREILSNELGMEPTSETVALAEQIRTSVPIIQRASKPDASSFSTSPTSFEVPLVGRAQEFRALVQNYQQVVRGQARVVLIEGEAGIGKTRLASDALAWARSQGAMTLQGQAYEMGGALPYQPVIDAVRPLLTHEHSLHERLAAIWLAECSRIFPELRERYPSLPASTSPDEARSRLFEALARLIQMLTSGKPLILFIDDVQWTDTATLDLLLYLVHFWKTHTQSVLLLCGLRSPEEMATSQPAWVSKLKRSGSLTHLHLGLITQEDILHVLEALQASREKVASQQDTEQTLLQVSQWLYAETEGHPFYLLETLKEFLARRLLTPSLGENMRRGIDFTVLLNNAQAMHRVLPSTVSEIITTRLHRLTHSAQTFLIAGAVLGRNADFESLCHVAGLDEQDGLHALDEVIQVALVREVTEVPHPSLYYAHSSSYQFTHDKIREVVYIQATTSRRRVFHRRALEYLQKRETPSAELACHAYACGQIESAFRYLVRAGDKVMEVFAVQDAILWYEQAHRLLDDHTALLHVGEEEQIQHLYLHLGRAYEMLEQWEQAQHTYDAMLSSARTTQNSTMVCMALNHLAFLVILQAFDPQRALAFLQEAQRIAIESQNQYMEAEIAWNLAQIILHTWHLQEAQQHALRALALARMLDIVELIARSLYVLSTTYLYEGKYEDALITATDAIALYTDLETQISSNTSLPMYLIFSGASPFHMTNQAALVGCLIFCLEAHLWMGNIAAGIENGRSAVALSLTTKNNVLQSWSLHNLNHALLEAGLYEEALATILHASHLIQMSSNILMRYYVLVVLGLTYQALFMLEQAQDTFEEAIALVKALPTEEEEQLLLVIPWLCVNQGLAEKWHDAAISVKEVIRLRRKSEVILTMKGFTSPYEIRALLYAGEKEEARREVQQLGERIGTNRRFRIPYLRALALLTYDDGNVEQAIASLQEAAQTADELGLPGEQWQIQAVLSNLLHIQGDDKQADMAWMRCASVLHELAEKIQDENLRSSFLQAPQIRRVLEREPVVLS